MRSTHSDSTERTPPASFDSIIIYPNPRPVRSPSHTSAEEAQEAEDVEDMGDVEEAQNVEDMEEAQEAKDEDSDDDEATSAFKPLAAKSPEEAKSEESKAKTGQSSAFGRLCIEKKEKKRKKGQGH